MLDEVTEKPLGQILRVVDRVAAAADEPIQRRPIGRAKLREGVPRGIRSDRFLASRQDHAPARRLEAVTLAVRKLRRWLHGKTCTQQAAHRTSRKEKRVFLQQALLRFFVQGKRTSLLIIKLPRRTRTLPSHEHHFQPLFRHDDPRSARFAPGHVEDTRKKPPARPRTGQAPEMPASLWRHTLAECEATRRHGVVARSFCGLLGVLNLASVAVAVWQTHALLGGKPPPRGNLRVPALRPQPKTYLCHRQHLQTSKQTRRP